jgi:DNA-binding NarL/FixJ family response regulator
VSAGAGPPAGPRALRVVVADDHPVLREGLCRLLAEGGLDVVGTAGDGEELLRTAVRLAPDVAVVDIRMPPTKTTEGLRAARRLQETLDPAPAVLLLSGYIETRELEKLIAGSRAGVGYLLKEKAATRELLDAIRMLSAGESVIDSQVISRLLNWARPDSLVSRLTQQEHAVLTLMAQGRSNDFIAATLVVSPRTVETHVAGIFAKLGLPPAPGDHRRVLAVLAFLAHDQGSSVPKTADTRPRLRASTQTSPGSSPM